MITISNLSEFPNKEINRQLFGTLSIWVISHFDHINRMITLLVITLSDFHCNVNMKWQLFGFQSAKNLESKTYRYAERSRSRGCRTTTTFEWLDAHAGQHSSVTGSGIRVSSKVKALSSEMGCLSELEKLQMKTKFNIFEIFWESLVQFNSFQKI